MNTKELKERDVEDVFSEEIGLHFQFIERKQNIRGKTDLKNLCVLKVVEEGIAGDNVTEEWEFESWEELKEKCPTFVDLLEMCSESENWDAEWRGNDRVLYTESIEGHEGLYDDHKDKLNLFDC